MPSANSAKLLKPSTTVKGGRLVIDRTKSGVPGLDEMMGGGLPKGNLVVLSGDPGSGKTVFCWQFLYEGAAKYDEPGVYVSLEETEEAIVTGALEFGMDFREMIDNNKLKIITIELYDFERLKSAVEDTIASINAVRVVIDPGVIFRLFFDRELEARKKPVSVAKPAAKKAPPKKKLFSKKKDSEKSEKKTKKKK